MRRLSIIVLSPEAVLADESEEEKETREDSGNSESLEGITKVVLDGADARLCWPAISN